MKGYYLSPTKQEMHIDWKKYAQKNMFPHTEVCPYCSMIIEVQKLSDLDNYFNTYGYGNHTTVYLQCLGCNERIEFTGGDHLPEDVKKEIKHKIVIALSNIYVKGRLKTLKDYEPHINLGMSLIFMFAMMIIF